MDDEIFIYSINRERRRTRERDKHTSVDQFSILAKIDERQTATTGRVEEPFPNSNFTSNIFISMINYKTIDKSSEKKKKKKKELVVRVGKTLVCLRLFAFVLIVLFLKKFFPLLIVKDHFLLKDFLYLDNLN